MNNFYLKNRSRFLTTLALVTLTSGIFNAQAQNKNKPDRTVLPGIGTTWASSAQMNADDVQQEKTAGGLLAVTTKPNMNYTTFTQAAKNSGEDVKRYNSGYEQHPELGMNIPETPCSNCYELIGKRTETQKYFVKEGSEARDFILMSSAYPMHYKDAQGQWLTVKNTLQKDVVNAGNFYTKGRLTDVAINAIGKYSEIATKAGDKLRYNNDLELVYVRPDGTEQFLGKANWNNYTAGDNGVYVKDAWPGIDLEMSVLATNFKTGFIVKAAMPAYAAGKLLIRDHMQPGDGMHLSLPQEHGTIDIKNRNNETVLNIGNAIAYEQNATEPEEIQLSYKMQAGNVVDIEIPGALMNKAASAYPLVIDPLATSILSSGFTYSNPLPPTAGSTFCNNVNNTAIPGGATITDVKVTFSFYGPVGISWAQARFSVSVNGGLCPSAWVNCNAAAISSGIPGNTCGYVPGSTFFAGFAPCLPPFNCNAYTLPFELRLAQTQTVTTPCVQTAYATATGFYVVVEGSTAMLPSITPAGPATLCMPSTLLFSGSPASATWSSSNPLVATVSGAGLVTGASNGSTNIILTTTHPGGVTCTSTVPLTVGTTPTVTGTFSICFPGSSALTGTPGGGAWSSSLTSVATVSGTGLVTAAGIGTTIINYNTGTCSANIPFDVNAPAAVAPPTQPTGITFPGTSTSGGTINFTPNGSTGYLVVASTSSTLSASPVMYTTYPTGSAFGGGIVIQGSTSGSSPAYTTSLLNSNTRYYIFVFAFNNNCVGPQYCAAAPLTGSFNTCILPPTGLTTGVAGANSVPLSWTASPAGGGFIAPINYNIYAYLDAGLTLLVPGFPIMAGTGTSFTVGGLMTGTQYWFRVSPSDACNTMSNVATAATVCTAAGSVPYLQTFEIGTLIGDDNPNCMTSNVQNCVLTGVNTTSTFLGTINNNHTPGGTKFYSTLRANACSAGWANQWLVLPTLTLQAGTTYTMSTWYRTDGNTWTTLSFQYSNTGVPPPPAITGTSMPGTAVNIGPGVAGTATTVWTQYLQTFTVPTTGVYFIGINMASAGGSQIALDDIEVCAVPTVTATNSTAPYCAPANVTIASTGTSHAVTYNWSGPSGFSSTVANPPMFTGVGAGVYSYTLTASNDPLSLGFGNYCTATATTTFTVNNMPAAITGLTNICTGATTTLSNSVAGGSWSSSVPAVGTVDPLGVVTGLSAGTTTISYDIGGCFSTIVVTVIATPSPITGTPLICLGSGSTTTTLSSSPAGGTWSSSNTLVGTVNSLGVVQSVGPTGTTTISYSFSLTCFSTVNVTVANNPAPISGPGIFCIGTTVTFTSTPGSFWSVTPPGILSINPISGAATGVAAGTATIVANLTGCTASTVVTVVPTPVAIVGSTSICIGFPTVTYTNATPGGTWSASNGNVTINSATGDAVGNSVGSTVISYITSPTCFSLLTVNVQPTPPPVTGTMTVCVGATTTLNNTTGGGIWSSACPAILTVAAGSGVVTAGAQGTCIVTYTLPGSGCISTATVTVHPTPANITGILSVCQGATTPLANATPSGSWSSSNSAIGTIGTSSGIAYGVSATPPPGTTTISYTLNTGCYSTATLTVNPIPLLAVSSPTVCVNGTTTVTPTPSAGAFSSTNTFVATVSGSGVVTGHNAGTTTISFSIASGCAAAVVVTVVANPGPITGSLGMCTGLCTTLNSSPAGGTWNSGTPAVAVVSGSGTTAGVPYGIICGATVGTSNITYTVAGCISTAQVSVNTVPAAPTGPTSVCVNSTVTLNATPSGGTWSGTPAGTVNVTPATGEVTGVAPGTATITYSLGASGCMSTRLITVNPLPNPIVATSLAVCVGNNSTLSSSPAPGTWASVNTAIGSINTTGLFTGTGAPSGSDTVTLTYSLSTGCQRTFVMTVNQLPAVITGATVVCEGSCTPLSSTPAGTWSVNSPLIGTVDPGGNYCGLASGTNIVTFTLPTGCYRTRVMAVDPLPTGVTPAAPQVCVSSCTTISGIPSGGTWASGNLSVATITPSGSLCGVAPGTVSLIYTLPTGCARTFTATVNALPAAISGPAGVCVGATVTFTSTPSTGTWSSLSSSVTVNSGTGEVTGNPPGGSTATISYTLPTGCRTTAVVSVYTLPAVITATPSFGVCVGNTITMNTTPGGTWSSSAPATGSINTGGVVTGVASTGADVITISNTNSNNCVRDATVTVYAPPTAITGSGAACIGSCTTLTSTPSGGTWTSSNSSVATIGSASGAFCGVSGPLTVNVTYTLPSGCFTTRTMTVQPLPPTPTAPSLQVCAGSSISLSGPPPGSIWTTSDPSVATVDASGVVTGNPGVMAVSTATITATLGSGCASSVTVTVNPIPTSITGSLQICESYGSTTLTGTLTGGTWSSSTTSVATIGSASGIATAGATFGTTTITYRYTTTGCYRTAVLSVNQLPSAFTGPNAVCVNETVTLNSTPAGGTWSSPSGFVAVNATTGEVTGLPVGATAATATISYANGTTGCVRTGIMTVNPLPDPITGIDQVCVGSTTTLNTTSGGGSWNSGNTFVASITSGGVVTGNNPGTSLISYTFISTGCRITRPVTVNQLPTTISGPNGFCNFTVASYSSTPTGGTWSSSAPAIVDFLVPSSGDASAGGVGTATITYTLPTGCTTTKDVFTIFAPYPIKGKDDVCIGDTIIISDTIGGGSWAFSPGTGSITLTPLTPFTAEVRGDIQGTVTVTYTLSTGCYSAKEITVNPVPTPITGVPQVCVGLTTDLDNLTPSGVWSSSDGTIATVGTGDGLVTGIDGGVSGNTVTITYALGTGCNAQMVVTVDPLPDVITGTFDVCEGLTTTLVSGPAGGTWTSTDVAVATVNGTTGVVTGVNAYATGVGGMGQTIITYTLPTGCLRSQALTVNPLPAPINGTMNICENDMTVLSTTTPGGTWISSNPAIASINAFGIVTGHSAGTVVITYMLSTGCISTWPMTVHANPAAITGNLQVCAGFATNLISGPSGGVWSQTPSSMPYGTINPITGVVSGITAGLIPVSYTLGSGCRAEAVVTVVNLPAAISGNANVCEAGGTTLLSHITGGGIWSSSSPANAIVDPVTGLVTGVTAGTSTITYMIGTGCFNIRHVTVNPLPATITGPYIVCQNSQITLANATPGGLWSSGNTTVATISSTTGVLNGVAPGVAPVSYILTTTGCYRSVDITVNPTPAPIVGSPHICMGSAVHYTSPSAGGTWINSNPAVITFVTPISSPASVTVLPVTLGTATITYQFGTGCRTTKQVTVQALPIVFNVTGGGSFCAGGAGVPVGLDSSQPGVSYELRRGSVAAGYISGTGFPLTFGLQAVGGTYTVQATNATSGCQRSMAGSATVIVNAPATPTVSINVSPSDSVCPGETVTLNPMPSNGGTAPTYVWKVNGVTVGTGANYSFAPAHGDIASVTMTSSSTCITAATATFSKPITVLPTALPVADIIVSPNDTVCQHTAVTLTAAPQYGGTAPAYSWMLNGAPVSTAASYMYVPADGDIVRYGLSSNYRCRLATHVMSPDVVLHVEPILIPHVDIHADPGLAVMAGKPVTLTAVAWDAGSSPAYQWMVNSVPVTGATNSVYTAIFNDGDSIACMVTSSGVCNNIGTSSWVFITINPTSTTLHGGIHNALTLHPNPNRGTFTIRGTIAGNEDADMDITNMLGQVVYKSTLQVKQGKVDAQVIMDKTLVNGMYILTVRTQDGPQSFHFVMEQ